MSPLTVANESLLHPKSHPLRVSDASPLLPALVTEPLIDTDHEGHAGPPEDRFRPSKRWVQSFPPALDAAFRSFDNALIAALQSPLNSSLRLPLLGFALALTAFTSIEFGLVLPYCLYLTGFDHAADYATFLVFVLALVSQLPKRFVWRARPWMVQRALKVRKDKTSSFPSRAVTCAVVYGAVLAIAFSPSNPLPLLLLLCSVFAVLASAARIIVGAHYPSDCVFGLLSGTVITAVGWGLTAALESGCSVCRAADGSVGSCYRSVDPITVSRLSIDWLTVVATALASSLLLALLVAPPLRFWTKCAYVMGVLTPCVLFRISFLCPTLNGHALAPPSGHSVGAVMLSLFLALCCTLAAKVMNGLRDWLSWLGFLALASLLYVILIACRLNGV